MLDSQRALELRKYVCSRPAVFLMPWLHLSWPSRFFQPFDPVLPPAGCDDYISSLNYDGALDAYAEVVVWRLGGVRAMVRYEELILYTVCVH